MEDPIKIIWKYKNNHRRTQYHMYIFVGKVPTDLHKILTKIGDLNLYNCWVSLSKVETRRLESYYGEFWYRKLFNMYHINYIISLIKESTAQKKELTDKLGAEWISRHIDRHELMERKLLYSYESLIKDERSRKSMRKGRLAAVVEDETDLDYTTHMKEDISKIFDIRSKLKRQDDVLFVEAVAEMTGRVVPESAVDEALAVDQSRATYEIPVARQYAENVREEAPFVDKGIMTEFQTAIDTYSSENDDPLSDFETGVYDQEQQAGGCHDHDHDHADGTCPGCDRVLICRGCGKDFECHNKRASEVIALRHGAHNYYHECDGPMCTQLFNCLDCGGVHPFHEPPTLTGGQDAEEATEAPVEIPETLDDTVPTASYEEGVEAETVTADEDVDMEEIEKLYKDVDVIPDEQVENTTNLLKKALNDDNLFEKKISSILEFDTSKDNNMYDENLKDVYRKFYVTEQYIFKDDTVKVVKDKICCSIKNNAKFEKDSYLIPSRQYMWAEYYFNNKIEKIMIGQKWIRRNELLNIDVEPNNNLRYYEELRGNLKLLRDNIRRYGNKIRREDDDNNILFDYENYVMGNEIYMIDVYNEFGKAYNPSNETVKNLIDVYLRLYFPKVKADDIKYILEYLNGDTKIEANKMVTIFETINNDLIMNNEIMNVVEAVRVTENYKDIFRDNYITQSVIHVNLRILEGKIDLYRIFNEFGPTDQYPFLQYQTADGTIFFKFKEDEITKYLKKTENAEVLSKWFENSPYGISFKVKVNDKEGADRFTAINLNESGRIEYKTQWKEEDMATIEDIRQTYNYVKDLIKKINGERNKVKIDLPEDSEFKYAFINTIQKFELPEKYVINHNDLSEFSRYFYPYVALVIEPRKRQAKVQKGTEKSKFGTYLRYKRVSKYENQQRLEQRIMYFMRNYEYNDQSLANEISKQFNITEDRAMEEIEKVRQRYPNIKRSRKFLKKLENIPKYKPPGIGIDVQGKQREKYKIRISGARDKKQLDRIITFMNILIYLYVETYLYKKPERQILKEKLKKLTNIARRRSKVDEIVYYNKEIKTVKQMTQIDKRRIGFKPEKGQNQWTRSCQNSGNDKKRRPQLISSNLDDLLKRGYALNKKTGAFERRLVQRSKSGKKTEITLKTIKLKEIDENGNSTGNDIHYSCSPEENGDHMYIGFLTRSSNPHGYCMPCCFKKDPRVSKNREKREFFTRCLEQAEGVPGREEKITQKAVGDRLYILQDTNKIQEGRFGFLPKYLDFYFNTMLDLQKKIRHHYLIKTETGYFFKYGSRQDEFQFLNAVGSLVDLTVPEIKNLVVKKLEQDKNELLFISLNNGDIKTQFGTRERYVEFIQTNSYLDFDIMNSVLSIPGVMEPAGMNIVVFQKRTIVIKRTLEKERIKEDFYLLCQNIEDRYSMIDPRKKTLFMLKENRNYYPIVMVYKENELTKTMTVIKTFQWEDEPKNIVNHVRDFYERNCYGSFLDEVIHKGTFITARDTYHILRELNEHRYSPKFQVIDIRNKCKYIVTHNNLIVSVRPSGSIFDLPMVKTIDKYVDTFDSTHTRLSELYELSERQLPVKPIGVYFDEKTKTRYKVTAIMTKSRGNIPVIPEFIEQETLEKLGLIIENKPLYDKIDKEIEKGKENYVVDRRIEDVNWDKYHNESYELFRLEFSDYINREENRALRSRLDEVMLDPRMEKADKIHRIRLFLYKLIDRELYDKYRRIISATSPPAVTSVGELVEDVESAITSSPEGVGTMPETPPVTTPTSEEPEIPETPPRQQRPLVQADVYDTKLNVLYNVQPSLAGGASGAGGAGFLVKKGGRYEKFIHISTRPPNLIKYQVNNDRNVCESFPNRDQCQVNPHCHWTHSGCYLSLTLEMVITFVSRMSEELGSGDLKALEIMNVSNYFVSDIVDYNRFTERPGQKIIRSSSNTIKKVLNDLFGRENVPKIGKRRGTKGIDVNYQQMNADNPLKDMRDVFIQHIIDNNLSIFRAYVNGYYWLKHPYYDVDSRNLGYYSPMQTDLANYFKSLVIDWLQDKKYHKMIEAELVQYMDQKRSAKDPIHDFIVKVGTDVHTLSNCVVELYALNRLQRISTIVYDDNNNVIYIFDNGLKYHHRDKVSMTKKEIDQYIKETKAIQIRFSFVTHGTIPDEIDVIYNKS